MCITQQQNGFISIILLIYAALIASAILCLTNLCILQQNIVNNYQKHSKAMQRLEKDVQLLCLSQSPETSEVIIRKNFFLPDEPNSNNGWRIQELLLVDHKTNYHLVVNLGQRLGAELDLGQAQILSWRLAAQL